MDPDSCKPQGCSSEGDSVRIRLRRFFVWFALGAWIPVVAIPVVASILQGRPAPDWTGWALPFVWAVLAAALSTAWLGFRIRRAGCLRAKWFAYPFVAGLVCPWLGTLILLPLATIAFLPQWFYAILGVIGQVGACIGLAEVYARAVQPKPVEVPRRPFQFSLRALLLLATLLAILMGTAGVRLVEARRRHLAQRAIVEGRSQYGVVASYDRDGNVIHLGFNPPQCRSLRDDGLAGIEKLDHLEYLHLCLAQVSDSGLQHLAGLRRLERLNLGATQVTDAGLVHLRELTRLEELALFGTKVSDTGLIHLKELSRLERLSLDSCRITDQGVEHLKGLTSLKTLNLASTQIGDRGLRHLKGMAGLESLDLGNTKVTDAGLESLKGLASLRELNLMFTQVTDAGIEELHKALPDCEIKR